MVDTTATVTTPKNGVFTKGQVFRLLSRIKAKELTLDELLDQVRPKVRSPRFENLNLETLQAIVDKELANKHDPATSARNLAQRVISRWNTQKGIRGKEILGEQRILNLAQQGHLKGFPTIAVRTRKPKSEAPATNGDKDAPPSQFPAMSFQTNKMR